MTFNPYAFARRVSAVADISTNEVCRRVIAIMNHAGHDFEQPESRLEKVAMRGSNYAYTSRYEVDAFVVPCNGETLADLFNEIRTEDNQFDLAKVFMLAATDDLLGEWNGSAGWNDQPVLLDGSTIVRNEWYPDNYERYGEVLTKLVKDEEVPVRVKSVDWYLAI